MIFTWSAMIKRRFYSRLRLNLLSLPLQALAAVQTAEAEADAEDEATEQPTQPESPPMSAAEARAARVAQAAREAADMESTMLPRKKRKMYKGLQEKRTAKRDQVALLQARARKLAAAQT